LSDFDIDTSHHKIGTSGLTQGWSNGLRLGVEIYLLGGYHMYEVCSLIRVLEMMGWDCLGRYLASS